MKKSILALLGVLFVSAAACQISAAGAKSGPKTDLSECVTSVQVWSITLKRDISTFMGVSRERMPLLFCQRLADGVRSGQISYSDVNSLQLNQPTKFWMVIRGTSKRAKPVQALPSTKFRTCKGIDGVFQVPASQKCPLSGWANH